MMASKQQMTGMLGVYAQIQRGAQWHGHRDYPLSSSVRPEQLIEEITEPCLEHVELGIGDRYRVGPIVRDSPRRRVVLRRPTDTRPRLDRNVEVIGQYAQAGAWSGHCVSIARSDNKLNVPFLTAGTLDTIAGQAACLVFGETASPRNTSTA